MPWSTKKVWRRQAFWLALIGLAVLGVFTINTAPVKRPVPAVNQVQPSSHRGIRVPASDEGEGEGEETAAAPIERVIVMSWDVRALAKAGADYDRAALVLGDADVIVLANVDTQSPGKGFLNVLGELMEEKTKTRFCRAWTQGHDGTRLGYAYFWRESTIGYMEPNGEMHDSCAAGPLAMRADGRAYLGVQALFYLKSRRKLFEVAAARFDKRPRSAAEVDDVFRAVGDRQWPQLVAADFQTNGPDLRDIYVNGYRAALDASKRRGHHSHENIFYRNVVLASSGTVDLFERFPDARREDILAGLSDHFPIAVELRPFDESKEELTLVAKDKPAPPTKVNKTKNKAKPAKKKPKLSAKAGKAKTLKPANNPLEEEAGEADRVVDGE